MKSSEIINKIKSYGNSKIAEHSQRFFKTGEGQYGYGDIFLGIRNPVIRKLERENKKLPLDVTLNILKSEYHEIRLFALIHLTYLYKGGNLREKEKIYNEYLKNTKYINNWDLVDLSAHKIVGMHLCDKERDILYKLVKSDSLWERRISIISTFYFIKKGDFNDTLKLCSLLLNDKEDLIHKATGWMLREIGKIDLNTERAFLKRYYKEMPRTMLRYAIEKFEEKERKMYLNGEI